MNVGPAAHLSGQMSGQAAQMNQVAGSGVGVGVGGADGLQQHQPMQDVGAFSAADQQFVMLRTAMRQKIYDYIGRKQTVAEWQKRLPELAKRLEEILYRKFPNRNDYYSMMKGPIEPQLQFAIKTLSAQSQQNHHNPQMSRQIASSSGYGTMIPTPGMTQGTNGNSRIPYGTDSSALSSSGAGLVPQNSNMGTSMPGVGVGGADGLQQHQPMQDVGAFSATDQQFVMLRTAMRQKIYDYIGRKQTVAEWQKRMPELAKRLEEILYRKFPNRNDYYSMMKGPVEPQLQFAIKTLSAQSQQNQQNPLAATHTPSSSSTDPAVEHDGQCEQLASLQTDMHKLMLMSGDKTE